MSEGPHERPEAGVAAFLRGLLAWRRACPACGSRELRASSRPYGLWAFLIGVDAMRCRSCSRRFPMRAALARRLEVVPAGRRAWPGGSDLAKLDRELQGRKPR